MREWSNVVVKSPEVTRQLAELASVYAASSDPELHMPTEVKELHNLSGVERTILLLHTAEGNSKQFEAAVAEHPRSIAAATAEQQQQQHTMLLEGVFMHQPCTKRSAGEAGPREACAVAEHCRKHQRACILLAQHLKRCLTSLALLPFDHTKLALHCSDGHSSLQYRTGWEFAKLWRPGFCQWQTIYAQEASGSLPVALYESVA